MRCRAVYGNLTWLVATARLCGVVTVPESHEMALRCAGYRVGKVYNTVAREGDLVTLRRVREPRWGVNKARVTALEIGDTLTVRTLRQVQLTPSYFSRSEEDRFRRLAFPPAKAGPRRWSKNYAVR
jgi:hypothetical protein